MKSLRSYDKQSIEIAQKGGISQGKIMVDPGIGAWNGRAFTHDHVIINNIKQFKQINQPILIAISRK